MLSQRTNALARLIRARDAGRPVMTATSSSRCWRPGHETTATALAGALGRLIRHRPAGVDKARRGTREDDASYLDAS